MSLRHRSGRLLALDLSRRRLGVAAVVGVTGLGLAVSAEAAGQRTQADVRTAPAVAVVRQAFVNVDSPCRRTSIGPLAYHWPVKPFTKQHPIRGFFGDPRTIGKEQLGSDGPGSAGSFGFHNGVDISAPGGTAVYPVVSGLAHVKSADEVNVTTGGGRAFQYMHITPAVTPGEPVVAYHTVLGYVKAIFQHVHFSEIDDSRVHNPLDPGHLEPYEDHTVPTIQQITFTDANERPLDPRSLYGTVAIFARASDTTPLPVPGHWFGFPVTPAFVAWRLVSASGALVDHRVAADFRHREPGRRDFWSVYAEGTYQNFPDFAHHFYWHVPGQYLFNLTAGPLDTRKLLNGTYRLTVLAADTCGNHSTLTEQIAVHNTPTTTPIPNRRALPTATSSAPGRTDPPRRTRSPGLRTRRRPKAPAGLSGSAAPRRHSRPRLRPSRGAG